MKILGVVLIVLGVLGLVFGGITYTQRKEVVDVGPLEASVDSKERVPIPPIVGGVALAAGVVLLFAGNRRRAA